MAKLKLLIDKPYQLQQTFVKYRRKQQELFLCMYQLARFETIRHQFVITQTTNIMSAMEERCDKSPLFSNI